MKKCNFIRWFDQGKLVTLMSWIVKGFSLCWLYSSSSPFELRNWFFFFILGFHRIPLWLNVASDRILRLSSCWLSFFNGIWCRFRLVEVLVSWPRHLIHKKRGTVFVDLIKRNSSRSCLGLSEGFSFCWLQSSSSPFELGIGSFSIFGFHSIPLWLNLYSCNCITMNYWTVLVMGVCFLFVRFIFFWVRGWTLIWSFVIANSVIDWQLIEHRISKMSFLAWSLVYLFTFVPYSC